MNWVFEAMRDIYRLPKEQIMKRGNNMATCRECGAEHIVQYYCELCGNYGCRECGDHCPGCTNHMDELEEK